MSKTAILGACTAYGIARKYGYTGTEEEWNALQNSLKEEAKTYATNSAESATAAATSEKNAATSEANAKTYMDSAEAYKNSAFSATPEGYESNMQKLADMDIKTATGESLCISDTCAGGIKLNSIKGKSVQDGEPTPDAPVEIESVGDNGSIKITSCGKNLLNSIEKEETKNGVTFKILDSKRVSIAGTCTAGTAFYLNNNIFLGNGKYIVSTRSENIQARTVGKKSDNSWVELAKGKGNTSFIATSEYLYYMIQIECIKGTTYDEVFEPMIRRCDENGNPIGNDDYEPYQSTEITIPLTEPLRSIGDVKDEIVKHDGTWGVLKKISIIESYNGETITTPYISTTGGLDNGATVIYELATPTFEPFTDQTPFYGLSSFEGVTNIITDQTIEPTMELEYGKSMVGAYTLENHNTSKKNEAVLTDLQTAYLTTLAQEV